MNLLVLAQYADGALTLETRATIAAAQLPGVEVYLLLAGEAVSEIAFQAPQVCGITKIWLAQHPAYKHSLPASLAALIVRIVTQEALTYSHILCASTEASQRVIAHVCAMLNVDQPLEVSAAESVPIFLARPTLQLLLLAPGKIQPVAATGGATPVQWVPRGCGISTDDLTGNRKTRTMQKTAQTGRGSSRH